MTCPACGFESPTGTRFCGSCAAALPAACGACGFENPPGFRFCGSCGAPLARPAATGATAPPQRDVRPSAPAAARDPRSYTPRHLAEKILVARSALVGERKRVTVLFADIERSMELAEQVGAEEWHRLLDRFFAILAEGVHRFEGTINQFTGDGVMALFGAPIAHEDHARRACHAALHLADGLRRYGEELKRTLGLGFSVRMGMNSGEVVVGAIGDDLRMDYTAQGHTVGLAARMQQLAGPERTYLTEHTAALVSGWFRLRDLGSFAVKGAREPVRAYELEGVGPIRTRLDASRARGFARFVGRAEETRELEAALADAIAGAGRVVGVVAQAGVGKSRLCWEFLEACRARGIRCTEGHALPHGRMIPFLPWVAQLRSEFGIGDDDSDDAARDRIAGRALRLDEGLADSLPILFELLGVREPDRPSPPMDPEARQRRLVEIVQRLLRARSRREPAVLLFEDLHWMDGGSEALLAALVAAVPETRTLVVVTLRPEVRAPWMDGPGYRQISLRPLGPEGMAQLLGGILGRDPSLADLADRIRERAGGNPLFIEEVVQSLREAGVLVGVQGAYRLVKPVDALDIPPSVHAILAARIDRLAEREKAVLQTAAVIGTSFSEPVLERVVGVAPEELREVLGELVAGELIRAERPLPHAEYAFRHALTQEVAYRAQLADRRALTHGRVARAIEEVHVGKLDERAALLAHHHEAAGDHVDAARWSRRAARFVRSADLAQALVHWRDVVRLLASAPESSETVALELEARTSALASGWLLGISADEAEALFAESRALAERFDNASAVALLTAQFAGIQAAHGRIDEYVRRSWEAVRIAERTGDEALRAAVWPPVVRAHLLSGRLREALALSERALSAMPADPSFGTLLGYSPYLNLEQLRANLLAYAGRWPEAGETFERVLAVGRRHSHLGLVASASSDYAWWAALLGDPQTALPHATRALEIAERIGNQLTRVYSYTALGVAELSAARPKDAIAPLEQAIRIARETRTGEEAAVQTFAHLADAHLRAGAPDRAREIAENAVAIAARNRALAPECFARIVHARALLATAGLAAADAAAAALERALALADETGARCYEPLARIERARLAALTGDEATGERELGLARALFAEFGVPVRAASLEAGA
ncbi:MAG TPA: AAA family ATPase [Candidatus Binatia bacterium]|nr:AAA family ATPase [Candidatus Binatia bacterium]